jgi:hypothetical protein
MERWQNKLYEVSTRRCARITTTMHGVGFVPYTPYRFHGMDSVETFLSQMKKIPFNHRIKSLDMVMEGIPVKWWATHREHLHEWVEIVESIKEMFRTWVGIQRYMCSYEMHWSSKKNMNARNIHLKTKCDTSLQSLIPHIPSTITPPMDEQHRLDFEPNSGLGIQ